MHFDTMVHVRLAEQERDVRALVEQRERFAALGAQPAPVVRLWRALMAGAAAVRNPGQPGGATAPSREPAISRLEPLTHQGRVA